MGRNISTKALLTILVSLSNLLLVVSERGFYCSNSSPLQSFCKSSYPHLSAIIELCRWKSVVLFTDSNSFVDIILRLLTDSRIALYHVDLSSNDKTSTQNIIRNAYLDKWTEFLVVTTRPDDVMSAAEDVFRNESRRGTAAMPHTSRWLIVTWNELQYRLVKKEENASVFDNVALIKVRNNVHIRASISDLKPGCVLAAMWKPGRVREFQTVSPDEDGASCWIFPNIHRGFNERRLEILTKQDLGNIVTVNVEKERYEGYLIDILPVMAAALNFTFTLSPNASQDANMTWVDHFYSVADGKVDLGLSLWTEQPLSDSFVEVTSPIIYDVSTGIYKRPPLSFSFYLMFPFPPIVYGILITCLFLATALYVFLDFITKKKLRATTQKRVSQICDGPNSYPKNDTDGGSSVKRRARHGEIVNNNCRKSIVSGLQNTLHLLAVFSVAIMNQAYFPLPQFMSPRLVIWLWCLTMLIFYAIYTSSLTAEIVSWKRQLPFQTYEELIKDANYRWATFALTYNQTYFTAIKREPFDTLNKYMKIADYDLETIETLLNNNYVMMYGEQFMKLALSKSLLLKDLIFMENKLIRASFGLILPKDSELRDIFSFTLERLHDSGLINLEINRHISYFNDKNTQIERKNVVVLQDLTYPFLVILNLVVTAFLCLVLEKIAFSLLSRRQDPPPGAIP